MKDLKSLDDIFAKKLFRIPDYQRGYAWGTKQLIEFWDDLISLSSDRFHYTGVLTIKDIPEFTTAKMDSESWLINRWFVPVYVVDGQQRLTTVSIFIQCIAEVARNHNSTKGKEDSDIYIGGIDLAEIIKKYIVELEPQHETLRAYKFGYEADNPSFEFMRYRIFGEQNEGTISETFYTLNLENAKIFFLENLRTIVDKEGMAGLGALFNKLVHQFLFNLYEIDSGFDEFVAFETMNNRGKQLSNLELLKNRLIYISTLYDDEEVSKEIKRATRKKINEAWKEVYHQLGKNKKSPLNDDEFLRAHWIMFFKYSRNKGDDYIRFLLDEYFSPKKVFEKVTHSDEKITLIEELSDIESQDDDESVVFDEEALRSKRTIKNINDYVGSLKSAAKIWAATYFPNDTAEFSEEEKVLMDKINRVKIAYFRPLIMSAILKTSKGDHERLELFKGIERFIFINLRLCRAQSNYRSSNYYRMARAVYFGESSIYSALKELGDDTSWTQNDNGTLNISYFKNFIDRKFGAKGDGYYGWADLRYFLYEYEEELKESRNQGKLEWVNFVKSDKDKISIEHIYPQTADSEYWQEKFSGTSLEQQKVLNGSLGNLLPLSASINSSLQNDDFDDKKKIRKDDKTGKTLRNGYSNGSYSELEVSANEEWTPEQIKQRGIHLLNFMERRWGLNLGDDQAKVGLLHLEFLSSDSANQEKKEAVLK
jgi:uncharacterized protein with ParB-like and HNH nuclease domain